MKMYSTASMMKPPCISVENLRLNHLTTDVIHEDTEASLMKSDPMKWHPIIVSGKVVIDGKQRVLVARKHGIPEIPFRGYK